MRSGHLEQARHLFQTSASKAPHLYESHFNLALLNYQVSFYNQLLTFLFLVGLLLRQFYVREEIH